MDSMLDAADRIREMAKAAQAAQPWFDRFTLENPKLPWWSGAGYMVPYAGPLAAGWDVIRHLGKAMGTTAAGSFREGGSELLGAGTSALFAVPGMAITARLAKGGRLAQMAARPVERLSKFISKPEGWDRVVPPRLSMGRWTPSNMANYARNEGDRAWTTMRNTWHPGNRRLMGSSLVLGTGSGFMAPQAPQPGIVGRQMQEQLFERPPEPARMI